MGGFFGDFAEHAEFLQTQYAGGENAGKLAEALLVREFSGIGLKTHGHANPHISAAER